LTFSEISAVIETSSKATPCFISFGSEELALIAYGQSYGFSSFELGIGGIGCWNLDFNDNNCDAESLELNLKSLC